MADYYEKFEDIPPEEAKRRKVFSQKQLDSQNKFTEMMAERRKDPNYLPELSAKLKASGPERARKANETRRKRKEDKEIAQKLLDAIVSQDPGETGLSERELLMLKLIKDGKELDNQVGVNAIRLIFQMAGWNPAQQIDVNISTPQITLTGFGAQPQVQGDIVDMEVDMLPDLEGDDDEQVCEY